MLERVQAEVRQVRGFGGAEHPEHTALVVEVIVVVELVHAGDVAHSQSAYKGQSRVRFAAALVLPVLGMRRCASMKGRGWAVLAVAFAAAGLAAPARAHRG